MTNQELIQLAIEARKNSRAIYSKFNVGAALLTKSGKVYKGCNIESTVGLTMCAERVTIFKAVSEGEKSFEKIAVVAGYEDNLIYTTPCGACRQFLAEFGLDLEVICGYNEDGNIKEKIFKLKDLLPETFELEGK
jgi:cytidine deaminase